MFRLTTNGQRTVAQIRQLAIRDGQVGTVWSDFCLPFFDSRCPRAKTSVKVGEGTWPSLALWIRRR